MMLDNAPPKACKLASATAVRFAAESETMILDAWVPALLAAANADTEPLMFKEYGVESEILLNTEKYELKLDAVTERVGLLSVNEMLDKTEFVSKLRLDKIFALESLITIELKWVAAVLARAAEVNTPPLVILTE